MMFMDAAPENPRLAALNQWIKDVLVDGNLAFYDRTPVLRADYTNVLELNDERATVEIIHRDLLVEKYEAMDPDQPVSGTCRDLAQWAKVMLFKRHLVDSVEVYACATAGESHYVVVAMLEGRKYLIDIGYSQPILEAVPVDGENLENYDYDGERGSYQAYAGKAIYNAKEEDDGVIHLNIHPEEGDDRYFPFELLTDELDEMIPKTWAFVTGSSYSTRVKRNSDGSYKVDKDVLGEGAVWADKFKEVHKVVHKFGVKALNVVFRR